MSLRAKLVAIVAFVALGPLALSAWMALRVHQRAFDAQLDELQQRSAGQSARLAQAYLDRVSRDFHLLVVQIDWAQLTPEERQGALALLYGLDDEVAVVSLLDGDGEGLGPSALRGGDPARAAHPEVSLETLGRFGRAIPFRAGPKVAFGEAVAADGGDAPLLPLAVEVPGKDALPWTVAVGLSLRALCRDLAEDGGDALTIRLLDGKQRLLCPSLANADRHLAALPYSGPATYRDAGGRELRAARVTLLNLADGWSVVAEQPAAAAAAPSRQIRAQALLWLALALAVALAAGLLLARGITRPVNALVAGAAELGRGRFDHRLPVAGGDELATLSRAFNEMSAEVEKRDREIRAWNDELQRRVDERTRELREAQDQLLRSQKVAAMSALGAGVAHEINNPLTGVLGVAQVLLKRLKKKPPVEIDPALLETIESEAQRIRAIVERMMALAEEYVGEQSAVDMNRLVDDAAGALAEEAARGGVEVVRRLTDGLPPVAGSDSELREALLQLGRNALTAMPRGGKLTLSTAAIDGHALKLTVADTGVGIAPEHLGKIFDPFFTTKAEWRGQGLGLTLVHRIVERHHGQVRVASTVGEGTQFTITLPAASGRAHLE